MVNDNDVRMSRLSGEYSQMRNYVRTGLTGHEIRGLDPNRYRPPGDPGRKNRAPYKKERERFPPRKPRPPKPQAPAGPKGAPIPYRPPVPKRGLGPGPLVPPAPRPHGGMARKGFRYLRGVPYLGLGFMLWEMLDRPLGASNPYDMTKAGYRLLKECPPVGGWRFISGVAYSGPDVSVKWVAADPNLSCLVINQTGFARLNTNPSIPGSNVGWISFGPENQSVAVARLQIRQQWVKVPGFGNTPALTPTPGAIPGKSHEPMPAPYPWPAIDPFVLPPLAPEPVPSPIPHKAIPHREPNPNRDPVEQPGGSEPATSPGGSSHSGNSGGPGLPAWEVPIGPGQPGQPPVMQPPRPGVHVRRPPNPRRERERKKRMTGPAFRFLYDLLGIVTESADLVHIFFDALDPAIKRQFRWKDSTILDTLAFVLENLEHVRIGTLVAGIVANAFEDAAFGRLGKNAGRMNQLLHEHFGIDLQGRLPKAYLNENPVHGTQWIEGWF